MLKRCFDLVASLLALVVLAPLLAAVAVAIKLDSPGTVFYRGTRSGRHGKLFSMLKFRTMVSGSEKTPEGTTGKDDPRVTSLGKFLRRYKIDEFPQLINVVKGEMSLVGPRPELPRYTNLYAGEEKRILEVRPGITDFSSITFSSLDEVVGATDVDRRFEEIVLPQKNALRVRYVKEQGFLTDLRILFQTVGVLAAKTFRRGNRNPA